MFLLVKIVLILWKFDLNCTMRDDEISVLFLPSYLTKVPRYLNWYFLNLVPFIKRSHSGGTSFLLKTINFVFYLLSAVSSAYMRLFISK